MLRRLLALVLLALPLTLRAQTVPHPFTFSALPSDLPELQRGIVRWADFDADGDLDLFLSGLHKPSASDPVESIVALYRNDGLTRDSESGDLRLVLTPVDAPISPVVFGDAAWADYDADADLDLVVTGSASLQPPHTPTTTLYRNDAGTLVAVAANLPALHSGSASWADHDGDGDLDLLLTGTADVQAPYSGRTHLLINSGGVFTEQPTDLPGVVFGSLAWQDFDGDARPDVALSGLTADGPATRLYAQQQGAYTLVQAGVGTVYGHLSWGLLAGQPSLVVTGSRVSALSLAGLSQMLTPAGAQPLPATFPHLLGGRTAWGDLDGDGDDDLVLSGGRLPYDQYSTHVYRNEGGALVQQNNLHAAFQGDLSLGDYDGDGDLDLLSAGLLYTGTGRTTLYRNERANPAVVPVRPSQLRASVTGARATLAWDAPPGHTYDVWVGSAPDRADRAAPAARLADGKRLVSAPGAAGSAREVTLALPPGTYYWGVQSVSAERLGSPFQPGGHFTVGSATVTTPADAIVATRLDAPTPSPARGAVRLSFSLAETQHVRLAVYDALGRAVGILHEGSLPAGPHTRVWNGGGAGSALATGLYFCRLETATASFSQSFVLLP